MELFSCRIFIVFIRYVLQFRFCIVDWCGRQKALELVSSSKCLCISHVQLNSVEYIAFAKPPQRKGLDIVGNVFVI